MEGHEIVSRDKILETIYDHYKDTFAITKEHIKARDRIFVYVFLTLTGMFVVTVTPGGSEAVASNIIFQKLHVSLDFHFVVTMLWLGLTGLVLRYCQKTITVERQYVYLHHLEDKINQIGGEDLISREGKSYLTNYPALSSWAHFVYTWVFPVMLIGVITIRLIVLECLQSGYPRTNSVIDSLLYILTTVSILLYLWSFHFQKSNRQEAFPASGDSGVGGHEPERPEENERRVAGAQQRDEGRSDRPDGVRGKAPSGGAGSGGG